MSPAAPAPLALLRWPCSGCLAPCTMVHSPWSISHELASRLPTCAQTDDLSRMFRLFSRIPTGLPPIGNILRKHITDVGLGLVKKQTSAPPDADLMPYVQELLDVHDKYTDLVGTGPEKGCFQGHSIFHKSMKEAFEVFVNKDIGKTSTAELLSNFCDNLLKKSGERLSTSYS